MVTQKSGNAFMMNHLLLTVGGGRRYVYQNSVALLYINYCLTLALIVKAPPRGADSCFDPLFRQKQAIIIW